MYIWEVLWQPQKQPASVRRAGRAIRMWQFDSNSQTTRRSVTANIWCRNSHNAYDYHIRHTLFANLFQWSSVSNRCGYITLYTVQVQYIYMCRLNRLYIIIFFQNRLYITPHMKCFTFILHDSCFWLYFLWLDFILHFVNSLFNMLYVLWFYISTIDNYF